MGKRVAKALGGLLGDLRRARGMTLRELSELLAEHDLEVSEATLQRVEVGRSMLRIDVARAAFRLLGMPMYQVDEVMACASKQSEVVERNRGYEDLVARGRTLLLQGRTVRALDFFLAGERVLLSNGEREGDIIAGVMLLAADCQRRLWRFHLSRMSLDRVLAMEHVSRDHRIHAAAQRATTDRDAGDFFSTRLHLDYAESQMGDTPPSIRAMVHATAGRTLYDQGCYAEALPFFERARTAYEDAGFEVQALQVRLSLGHCLFINGYENSGIEIATRCRAEARRRELESVVSACEGILGRMALRQDRIADARRHFGQAIASARRTDSKADLFRHFFSLWKIEEQVDPSMARHRQASLRRMLPRVDRRMPEAREFLGVLIPAEARRPALRPELAAPS